jgi:hypothetical protein
MLGKSFSGFQISNLLGQPQRVGGLETQSVRFAHGSTSVVAYKWAKQTFHGLDKEIQIRRETMSALRSSRKRGAEAVPIRGKVPKNGN